MRCRSAVRDRKQNIGVHTLCNRDGSGALSKYYFLDKYPKLGKKLAAVTSKITNRSSSTICLLALHTLYRELPRSTFQTAGKSVASHIYESRVCCLWKFTLYKNIPHPNDLRTLLTLLCLEPDKEYEGCFTNHQLACCLHPGNVLSQVVLVPKKDQDGNNLLHGTWVAKRRK